ncbi:tyrosine recombinase XerC [Gracilimonas mengyeensis]|uniref:Tyrosine recombinase XerC n=1 Tax=Gracilimonas mengyeensis TaxID=1302730 RepID=A0A521AWL1_9BACT|nr:tyrosine recombinase XerC [Gracilimonas mengyeensis]SMO39111.1 tyrosine recombinase XerC subunit [Gracilimonas mengyeensis]
MKAHTKRFHFCGLSDIFQRMKLLIEKYLKYLRVERNASEHTIISYRNDLESFLDFTAHYEDTSAEQIDITQINRLSIRLWLGDLSEKGLAKTTIARKVAALRSFFKYCFKRGHIDKNPAHLLVVPKKEKTLPKTATVQDIERMLDIVDTETVRGLQDRAILELFYGTGMRLSELTGLNLNDINLKQKQVTVKGKGNKQRIIPLGRTAISILEDFIKKRQKLFGKKTDEDAKKALFLAAGGQRIYGRAVRYMVDKYLSKTSEVTQKSPHVLRHSFATHMLDNGADIRIIKEFLGHANLAATQVYTHTSMERLKNVYEQAHPRAKN